MDLEDTLGELAPRVLSYCILRTGDPSLAEEIAQESLTALVQCWRQRGEPRSPDGFVFAIARRRAARAVFRRRLFLPLEHLLTRRDQTADPEAHLIEDEERRRLTAALGRLGRADRDLILLLGVADVATAEAARMLGISPSAVKMRAFRAKRRLRTLLENGNGHPGRR